MLLCVVVVFICGFGLSTVHAVRILTLLTGMVVCAWLSLSFVCLYVCITVVSALLCSADCLLCARFDLRYGAAVDCQCWSYVISSCFHSIFLVQYVSLHAIKRRKKQQLHKIHICIRLTHFSHTKLDTMGVKCKIFVNSNLYVKTSKLLQLS